jgi:hypothetical protein
MNDDERDSPTWWTVPQAAVWIRTSDLAAVESLNSREKVSLFMAAEAFVGAKAAAEQCLQMALERGLIQAFGRSARLDYDVETGKHLYWILEDNDEPIPMEFWKGATLSDESAGDTADATGGLCAINPDGSRWVRIAIDRDTCVSHWPPPISIFPDGGMLLAHLIEDLPSNQVRLDWLLSRPDVVVMGFNTSGELVQIPSRAFERSAIAVDTEKNVLTLGAVSWSAVNVALRDPSEQPVLDQETVNQWMRHRFASWPPGVPAPDRVDDKKAATNHFTCKGYRVTDLETMVRKARKIEAAPWTRSGPNGRKKAAASKKE